MTDVLTGILLWTLAVICVVGLVIWIVVIARVRRISADPPTIRRGLTIAEPPDGWPAVSLVIPAHNEERVIDACLHSLRAQDHPALEIILVLDRCTDRTLELARAHADADPRVVIIENDHCPDDWAGKCNAARLGAERATGDYLLFSDADTAFEPGLVRSAVAVARERDLSLLSLLSTLTTTHRFERIAQPVATLALAGIYPIDRVDRGPQRSRPFANGQFMLFRRDAYESINGHHAVRDDLLEDIAFARAIDADGGRCGLFLADGMLRVSMYDSFDAFRTGWKRIFIEACKRKPSRLRKYALRILILGAVLPAVNGATIVTGLVALATAQPLVGATLVTLGAACLTTHHTAIRMIYRMGGTPMHCAWYHPIGSWVMASVLREAARELRARTPIRWGGREYVLEPRD